MREYNTNGHAKYALRYHLLWCPKAGLPLREKDLEQALQKIISEVCQAHGYEVSTIEVQSDYIYVSLSVQPTVAPADIMRNLKSICTIRLLRIHPELKKHYSLYGSLWKKGYLITTGKIVDPEVVRKEIEI